MKAKNEYIKKKKNYIGLGFTWKDFTRTNI